jgi:excisionase family DNA binding protein
MTLKGQTRTPIIRLLSLLADHRRSMRQRDEWLQSMRERGIQIDEAYRAFSTGSRSAHDLAVLRAAQDRLQGEIEVLRGRIDKLIEVGWAIYREGLDELGRLAESDRCLLPVVERFARVIPGRNGFTPVQLLKLQRLLEEPMRTPVLAPEEDAGISESSKITTPGGMLTAEHAATMLGISSKSIYRLAQQGRLPYARVGRSLRFPRKALDAWLSSCSFRPRVLKSQTRG